MYPIAPDLSGRTTALIIPLADAELDDAGFDPRSHYAETFWLPILGPSTLWLMRNIAQRFDSEPDGFTLDLVETSTALGIRSKGGKNNSFHRAIGRVVSFNMGRTIDDATLAVRRVMPALHSGQIRRLSPRLQQQHHETLRALVEHREEDLLRSAKVAHTLLRLGDSPDLVEQQLISWGIEPLTANEAVNRAWAAKAREDSVQASA
ncbi:MAG: hypothetical protein R8J94_12410 [Acidimicrobiia bacterium]|nr:hypothetical protein [Acidimicrobiia bacterium]